MPLAELERRGVSSPRWRVGRWPMSACWFMPGGWPDHRHGRLRGEPTIGLVVAPACIDGFDPDAFGRPRTRSPTHADAPLPEMLVARAYEVAAAAVWHPPCCSSQSPADWAAPATARLLLAAFCLAMGVRGWRRRSHPALRALLSGRGIQVLSTNVARWTDPDAVFFFSASSGGPSTSQRLYELAKVDCREFTVSSRLAAGAGLRRARRNPMPRSACPTSTGVEPRGCPAPALQNFEGGTLLVGTTQSGKGVALANLVTPGRAPR